jgi:hypothetical protein
MDDREREDMVRAMRDDPELRAEVLRVERADRLFGTLIPRVDDAVDEEALERKILAAWERDTGRGASPSAEEAAPAPAGAPARPLIPFALRPVLALAACLAVLLGAHIATAPPALQWMDPDLGVRVDRGADPASTAYREEDLVRLAGEFEQTLRDAYRARRGHSAPADWLRRRPDWRLRIHLHELDDGLLQAEVDALRADGDAPVRTWSELSESAAGFRADSAAWAGEIADDLAGMTQE